jgi:dihydrofolate reductase
VGAESEPRSNAHTGYMRAGLLDELHVAIVPILLGGGERLFDNLDNSDQRYECVEFVGSSAVAHARFSRKATT